MRINFLLFLLAACDSQVDATHNGTPLANLSGSVQNLRTTPVSGDADVVIMWHNSSGSPDIIEAERVPVEGNFPAAFELAIYEPPSDALLNNYGDSKMGVAYIFSATSDADLENGEQGILGLDPDHLLVYVPQDIQAGTVVSTVLRGTPKAGFHIYDVGHLSEAEQAMRQACEDGLSDDATLQELFDTCGGHSLFDDFLPAPADLATPLEVDLVDDLEQLDVPNWT